MPACRPHKLGAWSGCLGPWQADGCTWDAGLQGGEKAADMQTAGG